MKMKFNLEGLKGKKVKFEQVTQKQIYSHAGIVEDIKEENGMYTFIFNDGQCLDIFDTALIKMLIKTEDGMIILTHKDNNKLFSGIVGYTMETLYKFPINMSMEVLKEYGIDIDMEGFNVLKNLNTNNEFVKPVENTKSLDVFNSRIKRDCMKIKDILKMS